MTDLTAVDSVDIQILVDNVTDSLSSVPSFVETEFAGLGRRRGAAWVLGGGCLCCAAHGLSCLLTIRGGGKTHTVLFDTGPEDRTFEQNVSRLGIDLGAGRGHGAEPRPLGSRRRHAARAAARARPQRRARHSLLHPPRHVPQPRHQAGGRFVPADGGCAVGRRPRSQWRPRRLRTRGTDDRRRHGVRERRNPAHAAASRPACPASIAAPKTARAGSPTSC